MDLLGGIQLQIDILWYNLLYSFAGLHWSILRGVVMMGYNIELLNHWLEEQAFSPLIAATNDSLRVAVGTAFLVALAVLGITYLLAAFIHLDVVSPRNAILWFVAGMLFFTLGPSFYESLSDFRASLSQAFYLSTLSGLQDATGDAFSSLSNVVSTDLPIFTPCDNLGVYLPQATSAGSIDGLDVTLAYLRADGIDIMGYDAPIYAPGCPFHLYDPATGSLLSSVPMDWNFEGSYFDVSQSSFNFETMDAEARRASIDRGGSAQGRMLTAWPLVLFGVVEQLVYLLITVAQGITFISFAAAILFAFFKKTEVIARSIIDQWIELIVQTVIIALVQSLVVAFFLAGTTSGNGVVVLGIGLICLIFMVITLWSGIRAVWSSFNRLFNAMGQATGGVMVAPGRAASQALGMASGAAGAVLNTGLATANAGSSALAGWNALQTGATRAQAAGLVFGGWDHLTETARAVTRLPGLRGTTLGDASEQFMEGAINRHALGPLVGAKLLTNRDPQVAEVDAQGRILARPMLIPAVGEGLEQWVVPHRNGFFTPSTAQPSAVEGRIDDARRRSDYASEMNSEELEQHLTEQLRGNRSSGLDQNASRLETAADALNHASQQLTGHLKVSGADHVAGVLADVVGRTGQGKSDHAGTGLDMLQVGQQLARALGVTPVGQTPPIQVDLARFGLFADQALRMGLSATQTEQVIREVKASPEGMMQPETKQSLSDQLRRDQNISWVTAGNQVDQLEHLARLLPNEIHAFGQVQVAPQISVTPQIQVQVNATTKRECEE
jgi:hypothetical protein